MMVQIVPPPVRPCPAAANPVPTRRKPRVTCSTCKLKGCIGLCHWEPVGSRPLRRKPV